MDPIPYYLSRFTEFFFKKSSLFFNGLLYINKIFYFNGHKNAQAGSGPCRIRNNCPPGYRSIIQDYGSADPDPKDIFTDPQHWVKSLDPDV